MYRLEKYKFTFYYIFITTIVQLLRSSVVTPFTFYYIFITTFSSVIQKNIRKYLHSTIFLLQQIDKSKIGKYGQIYILLYFYYN